MKPITILIADDHTLVREAWTMILNHDPRFTVVAECGTAECCIELSRKLKPDVVLLDINMPGMDGIKAVPHIRKNAASSKILGVSFHTQPSYVRKMIREGAMGYVTKSSPKEEMITAILHLHRGEKYVCQEIKEIISQDLYSTDPESRYNSLSRRELEVISLVKKGLPSREIATQLSISVKTVEVHRYNILQKLDLKNSAELVSFCNRYNLDI